MEADGRMTVPAELVNDPFKKRPPQSTGGRHHRRTALIAPRTYLGGKAVDGTLIGRSPNLKRQNTRVAGSNYHQGYETEGDHGNRCPQNAKPSYTGEREVHMGILLFMCCDAITNKTAKPPNN